MFSICHSKGEVTLTPLGSHYFFDLLENDRKKNFSCLKEIETFRTYWKRSEIFDTEHSQFFFLVMNLYFYNILFYNV